MTSKILSSNLNKNSPRRSAALLLIVLFCFFQALSGLIFVQSRMNAGGYENFNELKKELLTIVTPSSYLVFLGLFLGVILACSSFYYLHSKKEVDFYHSLARTRKQMFKSLVLSDVRVGIIAVTATVLLRSLCTVFAGCFCADLVYTALSSILCGTVIFFLFYLTMLTAILLTGHMIVAFMGFGVFCGYVSLVLGYLYYYLAFTFFDTFYSSHGISSVWSFFSPFFLSLRLSNGAIVWSLKYQWAYLAACCAWCAVLLILNRKLYCIRRLETAGTAMAFEHTKPVIRILIVVPCAVYAGIFLYQSLFTDAKWWILLGMAGGCILFHGAIEAIYQFDIKGIFSHKKQLLGCIAAGFAILLIFWLDLTGFDTWLPKKEELSSVMVTTSDSLGLGNYESSFYGQDQSGVTGDDLDPLLDTLKDITTTSAASKEAYEKSMATLTADSAVSDSDERQIFYNTYTVRYNLKNGKQKARQYYADNKQADELCKELIASIDYKKSVNSLYSISPEDIVDLQLTSPLGNDNINLSNQELNDLVSTYLEEYSRLDYDTLRNEAPYAYLSVDYYEPTSTDAPYRSSYMANGSYYIYPSFKNTIACLENHGLHVPADINDYEITSASWEEYNNDERDKETSETATIDDPEEIEKVKNKFFFADCLSIADWGFDDSGASISLEAIDKKTRSNVEIFVSTDSDTLQEMRDFLKRNEQ